MMDIATKCERRKQWPVMVLAGLLGLLWLCLARHFGVGVSSDSAQYMDAAVNLRYTHDLSLPPQWPPLYPSLLAGLLHLTPFAADAASLLSGLCFLAYMLLFGRLVRSFGGTSWMQCMFVALAAFLPTILLIHTFAWPEGVFSVLVLATCTYIVEHARTGRVRHFALAAVFAGLAPLTRYAGYTLVITLAGYAVWRARAHQGQKAARPAVHAGILLLAVLPGLLYLLRNWLVFGTLHGVRGMAAGSYQRNLWQLVYVFWQDLTAALILLVGFAIWSYIRQVRADSRQVQPHLVVMTFLLALVGMYSIEMLVSVPTIAIDKIGTRYFAPIYPCVLLLIWIALQSEMAMRTHWLAPWFGRRCLLSSTCALVGLTLLLHVHGLVNTAGPFVGLSPSEMDRLHARIGYLHADAGHSHGAAGHSHAGMGDSYAEPDHLHAGYPCSPGAKQLRGYLHQRLNERGSVYASVVFESMNGYDRPWLGRALFHRSVLPVEDTSAGIWCERPCDGDFILHVPGDGQEHRILYRELPVELDRQRRTFPVQRADGIRQALREKQAASFILLVNGDALERCGITDLPAEFLDGMRLRSSVRIEPYRIYELALPDGPP